MVLFYYPTLEKNSALRSLLTLEHIVLELLLLLAQSRETCVAINLTFFLTNLSDHKFNLIQKYFFSATEPVA